VRFQVLTAANMKFRFVLWDVLPCKIIVDRRFRGTFCPDDEGSTYLWNVGRHSIKNTAVYPRRFWVSVERCFPLHLAGANPKYF